MNTTWVTATELNGIPGLTANSSRRHAYLERIGATSRPRSGRGGGFEYLSTSLPTDVQAAIAAKHASSATVAVRPVATAMAAGRQARQANQVRSHAESMARLGVTLEAKGAFDPERNPRLDLFQRFEIYHRARGGAVWPAIQEFCTLWNEGQIDAYAATHNAYPKLPAKTMDKWWRAWRTQGVEALLERKPRADKGQTALSKDQELHAIFLAAVAEIHDPTARQVQRVIRHQLGDERTPPLPTLRRWLAEFKDKNKVALLKLKNPDGWRNKYMPAFGSRSEHITHSNEEWQLDSTIADAQQRVEVAFNMPDSVTGEIRRHALVAVIDVFTRRAQVIVSRTSSANAVKAVTRQAALAWGLPQRVKTDNGKDYTAKDYDFALKGLDVDHILCTPFSPDQKPFIERFLGTLLHDLFPMLEGFVGHDVATRKAIESAKSFAQRFGDKGVDLRMSPEQLQGVINGWLDEYHNRVHSELGCTPNEMAERHTLSVTRVDERALDLLLMPVAGNGLRMVTKRGISLGNAWFSAPELATAMGEQVYCRQDEADLGALHVFLLDGTYVCRALDHTLLGINRSELAAKARHLENTTIKPMVDALRATRKQGLAKRAAAALQSERQGTAMDGADNVHRLPPRVIQQTTAAVDSLLAANTARRTDQDTPAQQTAREAARAQFNQEEAAPVVRMDTPKHRYSAWVRLNARAEAAQPLTEREQAWMRSYQGSNEFEAWHTLHNGLDPLAEQAAG